MRKSEQQPHKRPHTSKRPSVIELFSGAGLFGCAFKLEGFELCAAYELDPVAARTYARNLGPNVRVADLSNTKPEGKADLIIAGPPCQGYSSIGRRRKDDPRNALALVIPDWAFKTGARMVVIENVALFLKSSAWASVRDRFEVAGYETFTWVLNAADVGAPQRRIRSFTVFSRVGRPPLEKYMQQKSRTVRDAFAGLPRCQCKELQHYSLPRTEFALERIRIVPEGGDIRDIARQAPHLVPPSWFRTKGKIIDIWGRMRWNCLSPTVRTGFLNPSRGRFLHPVEDRPITFREAARLQMVPDEYHFEGTAEQIARQIGNGVTIGLGRAMAQAVMQVI